MSRTSLFTLALAAIVSTAVSLPSHAQVVIWQDDDPITSGVSATSGGLIVDQIADPTGDPERVTVGDVSTIVTNEFSNLRPAPSAPQPVANEYIGKSFSFTMDYYVPTASSMQNNLDQTFFLSLTYRDVDDVTVEAFNAGFISYDTATLDTWQTLEITGTVPAGSDEVVPLMIFNNGTTPLGGTAIYVDNVKFQINGLNVIQNPIWFDEDPITKGISGTSGGLIVTQISDPTGDPDRVTVGEVDNSTSTQPFTNFRPDPSAVQPVPPELIGQPFSYTVDYFVPTSSTMQQNLAQRFFIRLEYRDDMGDVLSNTTNGFIGYDIGAPLDTWGQMSISGVVPEGAAEVLTLFIFNNNNTTPAGAAVYVDNVDFSIQTLECVKGCEFQLGDVNNDGAVNLLDVQPFIDALSNGDFICEADINEDGVVNLLDVGPIRHDSRWWISISCSLINLGARQLLPGSFCYRQRDTRFVSYLTESEK